MNPASLEKALRLSKEISKYSKYSRGKTEIVICPPFVFLSAISKKIKKAKLGAQDVHFETNNTAQTGEISPLMLKNLGVKYVIVGHSERRMLGETNEIVRKKIGACLKHAITPIVCVGESKRDESGNYLSFVRTQLEEIFSSIPKTALPKILIAYEPIWAIGKSAMREATPAESNEMAIFIKKVLSDLYDPKAVGSLRILYGGSVNIKNAGEFMKDGGVDGLLVGRDSLDPDNFKEIIKSVN